MAAKQEIHIHIHIDEQDMHCRTLHLNYPRPKKKHRVAEVSDKNMGKALAESMWRRLMFKHFSNGLNVYINWSSARIAARSGQSVETMSYEMEEAEIEERTRKSFKSSRGTIVTPEDLVDVMINKGMKFTEGKGISRELRESYLESRVQLLGESWGLKPDTISQLRSKVYQAELQLAS